MISTLTLAGFLVGVSLLQQQASLPALPWLFLPLILLAFMLFCWAKLKPLVQWVFVFLVAGWLGFSYAAWLATWRLSDALPKAWEKQDIEVIGVVADLPQANPRGMRFAFDIEQVLTPEATVPKHIVLNYYQSNTWQQWSSKASQPPEIKATSIHAGQRWQLSVRLKRPHTSYNPNGYDFEAWALTEKIRAAGYIRAQAPMRKLNNFVWRPSYVIAYCREKVSDHIANVLINQNYAGVIRALVIGDHSQINAQDWDAYLKTGTNHLMSISGLHITMLSGLAFGLVTFVWRRIPWLVLYLPTKKAAIIGGALAGLLYACLAGLSVPTQRTLIMLLTFAVALLLNKQVMIARALAIALLLVVLFDPWAVIAPGFWLSFSAVAFIAYAVANRLKVGHWLAEAAHTQFAVTLGLLPFLILMFGQASIISPIANAVAIPMVSLLVVPFAILGALVPLDFIMQAAHQVLAIVMYFLNWMADSPMAVWQQAVPPLWAVLLALLGVVWLLLPRGLPQRWLGLILILPMMMTKPLALSQGEMQVAVLDVGQGLAVVIKTAKHVMLYDAGPKYNQEKNAGISIVMPYLFSQGIQQLSALVVSHEDSDHSGGAAAILAKMPVAWLMSSYDFPQTIQTMPQQLKCYAGQSWVWDAVRFDVLYPSKASKQDADVKDNNRSCVIKVTSRYGAVLLTGDIEKRAEQVLLARQASRLKSGVLIAPHHGSKTSSSKALIDAVAAKYVVFTVGYLNRFKHPQPIVVSRYLEVGATTYRSDYDGAILIDFTEQNPMHVNRWRRSHAKYWHDQFYQD